MSQVVELGEEGGSSARLTQALLEARDLRVQYGPIEILHGVDFSVEAGSVHALIGENGAGKSTLLNVLGGRVRPTTGSIGVAERQFSHLTPVLAKGLGIATVPQHLELFDLMTVQDNLLMGAWPRRAGLIRRREARSRALAMLERVRLDVDPNTLLLDLAYVEKQMVEVARVTAIQPRIVILDEPTAALSVRETRVLFDIVRRLQEQGIGIIYVSHYLSEIRQIADVISVMRNGEVVASGPVGEFSTARMSSAMLGRDQSTAALDRSKPSGEVALRLADARNSSIGPLTLDVRSGEIVGIAAPKGEGVSAFLRSMLGIEGRSSGSLQVVLDDQTAVPGTLEHVGYLSEERGRWGVFPGRNLTDNLTISTLDEHRRCGLVSSARLARSAAEMIDRFGVSAPGAACPVEALSGGNQQKALLARLLSRDRAAYILDDPTLGVDIGSKFEIHRLINDAATDGKAIVLATSDLPELIDMSDRIIVIGGGVARAEYRRGDVSLEDLEHMLDADWHAPETTGGVR